MTRTLRDAAVRLRSGQAGYSLIELMISMVVMLTVTGAIFTIVNPAQGTFRAQPEVSDMQQRMRVGVDVLAKDLLMAGAGPYQGATIGALSNFFAPILPRRTGQTDPDAYNVAEADRITLQYVPNTASQTTISDPMPDVSAELKVNPQANCPQGQQLCGFKEGMQLTIFDGTGNFDTFTITKVQDNAGHLQHRGQQFSITYQPGAQVTQVESHTYWLDRTTNQLRDYDGISSDVPVVDNVVDLRIEYFGDPSPPTLPKPTPPTVNCLYDAGGNFNTGTPTLATLTTGDGSLAPLPLSMFKDGPWCPNPSAPSTSSYDADLLRIKKIRVALRVQVASAAMRGGNPVGRTLFVNPGSASRPEEYIPDQEISFEISPRNLNLGR